MYTAEGKDSDIRLPKPRVAGSSPVFRSTFIQALCRCTKDILNIPMVFKFASVRQI